jgi:hypothetical protein
MKESIINQLQAVLDETVQLLSPLDKEQLNTVPFKGSWTPAQVGQHLLLSETGIDELLLTPTEIAKRQPDEKVEETRKLFLDYTIKMESPDFILPEDKEYSHDILVEPLKEIKVKITEAANTANLNEVAPLPKGHPFEGYTKLELVHFVTYHTMRHNHQIKNMMPMIKK